MRKTGRRGWRRGISFLEILISLAIILVLLSLCFPSYTKALFKAEKTKTKVEQRNNSMDFGDE